MGVFLSKEGQRKIGLWEDGNKLKWFNSDEAKQIEAGTLNLATVFKNSDESMLKINEFPLQFQPPQAFYDAKQDLVNKVQEQGINVVMIEPQNEQEAVAD